LEKSCKIATARGLWLCSKIPAFLFSLTAVAFIECVSSVERILLRKITAVTHSKYFGFVFSALSAYFSLQTLPICWWGAKIFFAPERLHILATPLIKL